MVGRYPVRTQQGTGRCLPEQAMQMEMFFITAPPAAPCAAVMTPLFCPSNGSCGICVFAVCVCETVAAGELTTEPSTLENDNMSAL